MGIPQRSPSNSSRYQVFKRISLRKQEPETASHIREALKVNPLVSRILSARGFKVGPELQHFINPTLKEGKPSPCDLKNLTEACKLIGEIHRKGGAIAICCDFDVDGLSGGSLVHSFFSTHGVKSKVFVPDRFTDGYGLNERLVREIAANGFELLLTIDFVESTLT